MFSLAQQLEVIYPKDPATTIARRVRQIVSAPSGHMYLAKMYTEFADGTLRFDRELTLKINQTNVRLKIAGGQTWEESISGCPGWFRCDQPKGYKE